MSARLRAPLAPLVVARANLPHLSQSAQQRSSAIPTKFVTPIRYATPSAVDLQFKAAATLLFDTKGHTSSTSSSYEHAPQFCVTFDRNYEDAEGWKGSFEASVFISFQHLRVAIAPC